MQEGPEMSGYGEDATGLAKRSNLVEGLGSSLRDFTLWINRRPSSLTPTGLPSLYLNLGCSREANRTRCARK